MIVTSEILTALQTALTTDGTLNALVPADRIGNHLKDDVDFPHILWGLDAVDGGIKGETSYVFELVLDIWTEYRGEKQVYDISDALVALLDRNEITIASGKNSFINFETVQVDTESDGRTRHGTIVFRLMFTEN